MSGVVYYPGEHDRIWHGFPAARAVEWTRVLRVHWPNWPGANAMWLIGVGMRAGKAAGVVAWAERAREAEQLGFTPASYDRMHRALDAIPATDHPSHPDNAPDPRWPVHTIRPFDATLWRDWPWLVETGWEDDEAVLLLLAAEDLLASQQ